MIFTYFILLYIQFFFCCGAQVDLRLVTNMWKNIFHKLLKTVFKFSISEFSARLINKFKQYLRSKLVICEFIFCHFIQSNFFLSYRKYAYIFLLCYSIRLWYLFLYRCFFIFFPFNLMS